MSATLKFQKLHADARLPTRGSVRAAGLDLYACESLTLAPRGGRASVRTGLSVAIPENFYGRVAPRSGLALKHGVDVLAGVVDSDYRGELMCLLINHGDEPFHVEKHARIAQLIIEAIITPQAEWSDELEETTRGAGRFGSTGTN